MHSNAHFMLSKKAVAIPFGVGAFDVYIQNNHLIHLIINLTHSL